jgi:hypothetical protein
MREGHSNTSIVAVRDAPFELHDDKSDCVRSIGAYGHVFH